MRSLSLLGLLALPAVVAGCATPATVIVLDVDTEMTPATELASLQVEVTREGAAAPEVQSWRLEPRDRCAAGVGLGTPGRACLPGEVVVHPRGDALGRVRVRVLGTVAGHAAPVEQRATAVFREEETVRVAVYLGRPSAGPDCACPAGQHRCGTLCMTDASPLSCGAACAPCPAPPDATATCDGRACGFACNTGYTRSGDGCAPIAAPRLVAPLSTARVTSRRPTLRWAMPAGLGEARVEVCADRACARVEQTLPVAGSSVRPTSDLAPGAHFWRVSAMGTSPSATWEFFVGPRASPVDRAWGAVPDFDGDGRADLAVSAPNAQEGAGRVFLYVNGAAGLAGTPVTLTGPNERRARDGGGRVVRIGSCFGRAVASVGDLDGDGFADLAAGAFCFNNQEGAVFVYRGGANGIEDAPTWILANPATDPSRPDEERPRNFGLAVAAAGDLDGDGYADLAVSAHNIDTRPGTGWTYVYFGSPQGPRARRYDGRYLPDVRLTSQATTNTFFFGEGLLTAGDLDGDGFSELLVGESAADGSAGRVYVYAGGSRWRDAATRGIPLAPSNELRGGTAGGNLGKYLAAGDTTGDGLLDVVVGAHTAAGGNGEVQLFPGSMTVPLGLDADARARIAAPDRGPSGMYGFFGHGVACVGDFDGDDGVGDLAVGAYNVELAPGGGGRGAVYLYRGGRDVATATPRRLVDPEGEGDGFGFSVASPGDLDGDGFADLAVGSPSATGITPGEHSSAARRGRVLIYRGGAAGVTDAAPRILRMPGAPEAGDLFGWSITP